MKDLGFAIDLDLSLNQFGIHDILLVDETNRPAPERLWKSFDVECSTHPTLEFVLIDRTRESNRPKIRAHACFYLTYAE